MPEPAPVVRAQVVVVAQEFVAAQQEFGEVHEPALDAQRFVGFVYPTVNRSEHVLVGGGHVLGASPLVLVRVDEPNRLSRGPFLLVDIEGPHHPLDETQLIVGVENLEALHESGLSPVHAQ